MDSKSVLEVIHARAAEISRVAVRDPTPNLERFKERKSTIASVGQFLTNITTAVETLKRDYNNLKSLHADETNTIKQVIDEPAAKNLQAEVAVVVPPADEWITIAKKNRAVRAAPVVTAVKKSPVVIAPGIMLDATHVDTFDNVKSDGELYYVVPNEHFAIRINGILFHGNVGTIYNDGPTLVRTAECKYLKGCTRPSCEFYHDPIEFPNSSDVRNYHNSAFSYSPARDKRFNQLRHFGSLPNLKADVIELTPKDTKLLRDQAFHELLCAMIAAKHSS